MPPGAGTDTMPFGCCAGASRLGCRPMSLPANVLRSADRLRYGTERSAPRLRWEYPTPTVPTLRVVLAG